MKNSGSGYYGKRKTVNIRNCMHRKKGSSGFVKRKEEEVREPELLSCKFGVLTGEFRPCELIKIMKGPYYKNSANYLRQQDIDKLLSAPKVYLQKYKDKGSFVNISARFNKQNNSKKANKYHSSDIEYYVSLIEDEVHLFAVTYTNRFGVVSAAITYLPEGNIDNAIFLSRICYHANEHENKLSPTKIPSNVLHLHTASEKYYQHILNNRGDKKPAKIASDFVDPDAVELIIEEGKSSYVRDIAKELFKLNRHMTVDVYTGKSMIPDLKTGIKRVLER